MSSRKWSQAAPDAIGELAVALTEVAGQCFFAEAEPCPDGVESDAVSGGHWLSATVRFAEPGAEGALACLVPEALALVLFDAFNGREPDDPPPPVDQLFDLVGELSNMICGAWLTRVANDQAFCLSRPLVHPVLDRATLFFPAGERLTMRVHDLPLIVDIRMQV